MEYLWITVKFISRLFTLYLVLREFIRINNGDNDAINEFLKERKNQRRK